MIESLESRRFLSATLAFDPVFTGGVTVAAGQGGGPHVKVFAGDSGSTLNTSVAYDSTFLGGVRVAAGDVTGDGTPDIITGAGPGGTAHVK